MLLPLLLIAVFAAVLAGIFPLVFKRCPSLSKYSSFILLGTSGVAAIAAGVRALLASEVFSYVIPSGFENISWQFRLDSLSGFFLSIIGLIVVATSIYAPGYLRDDEKHRSIASMTFFTALFVLGMYLVLLANDAFSFMLAWELMSISSYFLVAYHHENTANRSAAFIYLVMAHISGLFVLLSFGTLANFSQGFDFTSMQTAATHLTPIWATLAFLFALVGFSMKAGIIPLHVWLPKAHPVAPSHISALMSGVMLKVSVYGLLRFCFSLLGHLHWQWGVAILFIGTISALLGVLYALMQHDLKELLAYHSVENIGIIFIGIGLSIIFISTGHPVVGALGLIAALYHCLNHALFKSLLFLGAGSILQQSHEHDLEKMGGLVHRMPYTALFFLVGCISISALPPFNGFVSEWLTFQTAFQAPILTSPVLHILIPVTAALLALTGALAAACFVKVYGVAFLGKARTEHVGQAQDPSFGMKVSMGFLSVLCLLFGILPTFTINAINAIPHQLIGSGILKSNSWLWLIPLTSDVSSYNAPAIGVAILLISLLSFGLLYFAYRRRSKIAGIWDCGFGGTNARMQYTATAFAMPIRRVFKGVWHVTEKVEKNNGDIRYSLHIEDWVWKYVYQPLEHLIFVISRLFSRIQGGNVRVYLAYAFFTLILLLWLVT